MALRESPLLLDARIHEAVNSVSHYLSVPLAVVLGG